jgi:hypothetical protein
VFEALGNIGDFIGGVGVLITLLYLASQIRQNSLSVRNAAAESVLQGLVANLQTAASSPQMARVISLGQSDIESLTEDERAQFIFWMYGWFRILERAYVHYRAGHVDEGEWKGHEQNLVSVMQSEAIQRWWTARKLYFGREFSSYVESLDLSSAVLSTAEVASAISNPDGTA